MVSRDAQKAILIVLLILLVPVALLSILSFVVLPPGSEKAQVWHAKYEAEQAQEKAEEQAKAKVEAEYKVEAAKAVAVAAKRNKTNEPQNDWRYYFEKMTKAEREAQYGPEPIVVMSGGHGHYETKLFTVKSNWRIYYSGSGDFFQIYIIEPDGRVGDYMRFYGKDPTRLYFSDHDDIRSGGTYSIGVNARGNWEISVYQ